MNIQQAPLLVAEHDGPTMFARIGMMLALHRHRPKDAPAPRSERAKIPNPNCDSSSTSGPARLCAIANHNRGSHGFCNEVPALRSDKI